MINRQKLQIRLLALLSLAIACWSQPAQAQGQKVQVNKYTPMTKEVPLADVPSYSGSKFQSGATVNAPGEGGGISYSEKFFAKESIEDVGKWYADQLAKSGWTVTLANRSSVYANKRGASVSLNLNGTHEPGFHCAYTINYTPSGK